MSSDSGMNYKLVPETVELLESVAKPVLSICDPYCSGKSYFSVPYTVRTQAVIGGVVLSLPGSDRPCCTTTSLVVVQQ